MRSLKLFVHTRVRRDIEEFCFEKWGALFCEGDAGKHLEESPAVVELDFFKRSAAVRDDMLFAIEGH